jgi:hypothetical protein
MVTHQSQKFSGKGQRLVKRGLETDSSGFEFLPLYLLADGKVRRKNLEIMELRC